MRLRVRALGQIKGCVQIQFIVLMIIIHTDRVPHLASQKWMKDNFKFKIFKIRMFFTTIFCLSEWVSYSDYD